MLLKEIFKESMPIILLCGIGELLASSMLMTFHSSFLSIPGLIIMIPAIIGLRGNVSGALGSRLGSAAHLGLIREGDVWNEESSKSICGSLILGLLMSVFAALLAFSIGFVGSGELDPVNLLKLVLIASITGVIAGLILGGVTLLIILVSFRHGYDPDNVITPGLATIGDIVTVAILFLTAYGMGVIL